MSWKYFLQPAGRDKVIQCMCLLGCGKEALAVAAYRSMNSLAYAPYDFCQCHSHMASTPAERRSRRTSALLSGDEGQITLPQTVSGFSRRVDAPRIRTLGTLVGVTASTSGTRGTRIMDCRLSGGSSAKNVVATPGSAFVNCWHHCGQTPRCSYLGQRGLRNESIGKQGGWWIARHGGGQIRHIKVGHKCAPSKLRDSPTN